MDLEFRAFPLTKENVDAWDGLLALNGGPSAPWITEAPGKNHQLYVCCLILENEPAERKKIDGEERYADLMFKGEEWKAYYASIVILVPVAVQNGIAMAQGIKRLTDTCPCLHLKRLAIALLAHTVQHFHTEYLFLSPIQPFKQHLERELHARGVLFGQVGYKCLFWALRQTEDFAEEDIVAASTWVDIRFTIVKERTAEGKRRNTDAVLLTITPPPSTPQLPPRKLLLNEGFYFMQIELRDAGYRPPPPLNTHETYDFLWFIAGDGVLVVHGPSLVDATVGQLAVT